MKLSNKRCYPTVNRDYPHGDGDGNYYESNDGLTFRERLIIALASNSEYTKFLTNDRGSIIGADYEGTARRLIIQADEIIKQLESEAKDAK